MNPSAAQGAPLVELPGGWVRGVRLPGLDVFKGLPYAAAPFGAHRFDPPAEAMPWPGVRDAGAFAPAPPQWPRQPVDADIEMVGGEDCLALNVWSPSERDGGAGLPVLVWIPGGGFLRGGSQEALYDGAALARHGLVVVSINYRIGADGFMQLEDAPANRGLLDQIAALQWVQRHIACFGGDPRHVTVMGQSAGAGALACLLGLPAAQGLMRRAILQSPSVGCQTQEEGTRIAQGIAGLLGVQPTRAGMSGVPLRALVRAVARMAADPALRRRHGIGPRHAFPLRPVLDGQMLVHRPLAALCHRWTTARPALELLVGSNCEEMNLYLVPGGEIDRIVPAQLDEFMLDAGLPADALPLYGAELRARNGTEPSPGELLVAMQSDFHYRVPARRIADLAERAGLRVHRYEFAWRSPMWSGRLGAAHGMELPFVFGTTHTPAGREFCGDAPPAELTTQMQAAWVGFAKTGEPGWPHHDRSTQAFMRFDEASHADTERTMPSMRCWDGIV